MNGNLAYRLQLSLEQLRTQALDGIRALLEKDNAHRVILNHNVIIHFVDENTYSETKEVYMTGQCFIVNSFGESELEELKYIPIASLLHILKLIEEGEYDIEDHIEDKDLSNHIQAQEDAHFDNFCQQNNI
jgi:hypothetical protein